MGHEGIRLAFLFPQDNTFYSISFFAEYLARTHLPERRPDIKVCLLAWNKNCLWVHRLALPTSSFQGRGIFSNCRIWDHNQLLQSWTVSKESCLPEAQRSPKISYCSTQDLHWLVQLAPYLLGHLLFRAGQSDATVFPSPPPTVQSGFKRTKDMHH